MKITIQSEVPEHIPDYLREFYLEGKMAKKCGYRLWECPHEGILPLQKAWQEGWVDEEWDFIHEGE
jgi:hypothetical protein